jgi:methionine synthase I (cobalamin-dependent)
MSRLLEALRSGRVLLMDGAMGSELRRRGLGDRESGEEWNLSHPARVTAVHRAYAAAGAVVHLTNTFQLYEWRFGGVTRTLEAGRAAVRLARQAADGAFVLAALGPTYGVQKREFTDLGGVTVALHAVQPVDGALLETCSSPRAGYAVARASQVCGGTPILLSLTYLRDDRGRIVTPTGHAPEWFAKRAAKWGVAALGVNCGNEITVRDCADVVRRYRDHTDLPLFARPNAGTPERVGDGWVYPRTPAMMAEELPELLEAGVNMVGGCCGTTPAHVAAFRRVIDGAG